MNTIRFLALLLAVVVAVGGWVLGTPIPPPQPSEWTGRGVQTATASCIQRTDGEWDCTILEGLEMTRRRLSLQAVAVLTGLSEETLIKGGTSQDG